MVLNSVIVDQFTLLLKQIEAEYMNAQVENEIKEMKMHEFRLRSIKKILSILKKIDFEITDGNQLKDIPGIGKGTISRIDEILGTGVLSEIKNKYDKGKQDKINSIQELEKIIGVGSSTAKKLVLKNGITSVAELRKAIKEGKIEANDKLLLGLKYYGVVQTKIPRAEITMIEKYLVGEAHKIDGELELKICGSYRRGKSFSGDIDVLMFHPDVKVKKGADPSVVSTTCLTKFVDRLTEKNFLLDHMTDKNYSTKYMGFCKYKNKPVRRIDIRFIPYDSIPAAMVYFTGPYELNTVMRTEAKKKGMLLNEYGLYKIDERGKKELVQTRSEEEVFKKVGMKYLSPEERESFNASAPKN